MVGADEGGVCVCACLILMMHIGTLKCILSAPLSLHYVIGISLARAVWKWCRSLSLVFTKAPAGREKSHINKW